MYIQHIKLSSVTELTSQTLPYRVQHGWLQQLVVHFCHLAIILTPKDFTAVTLIYPRVRNIISKIVQSEIYCSRFLE